MTKQDENGDLPELESLARQYRETRAPLGFAERVAAHVKQEQRSPWWSDTIAAVADAPKTAVTVTLGIIALLSVILVQTQFEPDPDLQIAKQDRTQQSVSPSVTPSVTQPTTQTAQKPVDSMPAESIDVDPSFYEPATNGGYANLAALSDVSVWLDEETDSIMPEDSGLPEMPDLGDIEAAFDTT